MSQNPYFKRKTREEITAKRLTAVCVEQCKSVRSIRTVSLACNVSALKFSLIWCDVFPRSHMKNEEFASFETASVLSQNIHKAAATVYPLAQKHPRCFALSGSSYNKCHKLHNKLHSQRSAFIIDGPLTNRKSSKEDGSPSSPLISTCSGKNCRPSRGMEEDIGRTASDLVSKDCQNSTGFFVDKCNSFLMHCYCHLFPLLLPHTRIVTASR